MTASPLNHIGAENLALVTSDFTREDITYIHYNSAIYHQLAEQLASRIASRWVELPAINGTMASLRADFVRGIGYVNGGAASLAVLFPRTGGSKVVVGEDGNPATVAADTVAFDYSSGRRRMLLEGAATNLFLNSATATTQSLTVTAQSYTVSFWGSGSLVLSGAHGHTVTGSGTNVRTSYTFTPAAGTLTLTPSGTVANVQLEIGGVASSYIVTTTAAATRTADVCAWSGEAAATLTAAGPCTLALRGAIALRSGSTHRLISETGGGLLALGSSGGLILGGASSSLAGGTYGLGPLNDIHVCAAWGSSSRMLSTNGAAVVADNVSLSHSFDEICFGYFSGIGAGDRFEIDELLVWPVKGSASAIQAQSRVWA